jgi:hypothetical protein
MALSQPRPMATVSFQVTAELKARLDAVVQAAKAQGYEFSFDKKLAASLATLISRDERFLGVGKFAEQDKLNPSSKGPESGPLRGKSSTGEPTGD